MALLWLAAESVLPGWFGRWWAALHAYVGYNDPRSLIEILLGKYAGLLISALIGSGVALVCWRSRRSLPGSDSFNASLLSVVAGTLLIKPKFPFYDLVVLLPVVIWLFGKRRVFWRRSRPVRDLFFTSAFLLGWQWFIVAALAMISLVSPSTAQRGWDLPAVAMFLLPVALLCLLALFTLDLWKHRTLSQTLTSVSPRWPGVMREDSPALSSTAAKGNGGQ